MKLIMTKDYQLINANEIERLAFYGAPDDATLDLRAYTTSECFILWSWDLTGSYEENQVLIEKIVTSYTEALAIKFVGTDKIIKLSDIFKV